MLGFITNSASSLFDNLSSILIVSCLIVPLLGSCFTVSGILEITIKLFSLSKTPASLTIKPPTFAGTLVIQ